MTNEDYVIDVESINEVAELIQQYNPYRCTESLHSIRKSIWQLIQKALETESWSMGSGGVVVMIGSDNTIDVLYSPCRDHKFVTINVDEIMENSYE